MLADNMRIVILGFSPRNTDEYGSSGVTLYYCEPPSKVIQQERLSVSSCFIKGYRPSWFASPFDLYIRHLNEHVDAGHTAAVLTEVQLLNGSFKFSTDHRSRDVKLFDLYRE